ncbi:hypothetical protein [Robiginitalea sp.]|uniref:hypothetical protein n=1 Tax=Robiginitalea sp. TaxID=1902411 RepID=UPI003C629722
MKNIITGTLVFIVVSFAAQSISHFAINADHYSTISFMRAEPIFILGFLTMIMQGIVVSYLFLIYSKNEFTWTKGLAYGLILSAFFVSYPALVEPAKYKVPSISSWILVEATVGVIQFGLIGILLSVSFQLLKKYSNN